MFIDSHCHLSFDELYQRLPQVLADMQAAQVEQAVVICTTLEEFDRVHGLAREHACLFATAGVHPDTEGLAEPDLPGLLAMAARPKVVAIGETGLDYYRLNGRSLAEMEWQRQRFRIHIRAGGASGLPLVVHTRSASDDTLAILREEGVGEAGGVFHCFTETEAVARAALDLGFHISFSGILTFKNAQPLREVVRWMPLDRLLIETDSPYLAPVPHRGKLNSPAWVPHVASCVAEVKQLALAQVAQATTANARRLFRLPEVV